MASTKRQHIQAFVQNSEPGPIEVSTKHRQCSECGATSTPQWRQGPSGPQTLCNACGVRYSRLTRRVKVPKRQHTEFSSRSQEEMLDVTQDSGSEDTSKGTTIQMAAPSTPAMGTPTCAPSQLNVLSPLSSQHTYPTGSPIRLARAIRTGSGLLNLAPCSPAGVATPPASANNSRRSSTGGSSLPFHSKAELPFPIKAEVQPSKLHPEEAANAGKGHEDEDLDCQAALNLLSMAAGPPCHGNSSPRTPQGNHSPSGPGSPMGGVAVAAQQQASHTLAVALSRQPSTTSAATIVAPPVGPAELRALQQLCSVFDQRFKDLVAARAACEAVSQVLLVKQEEARAAQQAARHAAQALMLHAQDLSCHEDVMHAISQASSLTKQPLDPQPQQQQQQQQLQQATGQMETAAHDAALVAQPHSVDSRSSSSTASPEGLQRAGSGAALDMNALAR